ncbi:MAG: pilus assembly protein [Hyphomicrobiales bacterium]|nr:pilus assembly protein [Hyphomicrobiales bacterium]
MTLVEFAIVVVPFFILLFGSLELGFVLWGTYDLENATNDVARSIRTGEVRSANLSPEQFRERVCSQATLLPDCANELRVDVRSFTSVGAMQAGGSPEPLDEDGNLQDNFTWNTGGPSSVVLVTAFYPWPLFNLTTAYSISNMADGNRLLRTSIAFRNEPYPDN